MGDATYTLRDKSEVEGVIASASEPKFKPRKGASALRQGWSGVAAQPLLAKKNKIEPGATERQRRSVGRQHRCLVHSP